MSAKPRAVTEPRTVTITVELDVNCAAALARLCQKFGHYDGDQYLYPHIDETIRAQQRYDMVYATTAVEKALAEAGVGGWPWVETGSAE